MKANESAVFVFLANRILCLLLWPMKKAHFGNCGCLCVYLSAAEILKELPRTKANESAVFVFLANRILCLLVSQ